MMTRLITVLSVLFFTNILSAQTEISIDSVSVYIGKTVKVCSKVAGTFVTKGDKPVTYLNLGADYPNTKLTIVIFQKDLVNFPLKPSDHYKGQNVCVTGEIKQYKEKIEIIANKPEQIEMKDK
jgi:RecG-like helicase